MKIVLSLIFFLILSVAIKAQKTPEGSWELFDADVLGYFYLSDGKQLIKTSAEGKYLATYQNNFLGDISQIDCYKGLIALVYHQSANVLVLLDNNLVQLGRNIDLTDAGFYEVYAACLGIDDQIWIADRQSGQLLLLNKNLKVQQEGAVFRQYTNAENIIHLSSRDNLLFMVTDQNEFIIFDRFGTFSNKLTFNEIKHPFLTGESLFFMDEKWLFQTHLNTFETDTITKINNTTNAVLKSKNQLYLLEDNKINKLKR